MGSPFMRSEGTAAAGNLSFGCADFGDCTAETYNLCAQAHGADPVDFLVCMDTVKALPEVAAQNCSKAQSLSWGKISECFSGNEGLQLKMQESTMCMKKFPKKYSVPWVEVDGVRLKDRSYNGILTALCADGIDAAACSNITNASFL